MADELEVVRSSILELAPSIAASFSPPSFTPVSYLTNPHVMTIIGMESLYKFGPDASTDGFCIERVRYPTPDGDFFDVDFIACELDARVTKPGSTRPLVVMLHGLESTSRRPLCCRLAHAYQRRGFDCAIICFRGCSGEMNRTPGGYNLGFIADLDQLCRTLHADSPQRRMYLSGFSLGANAICKYIGELGDTAPDLGVYGAAVCNTPFAPLDSSPLLESGIGKWVYSSHFLKTLKPKAEAQAAMLTEQGQPVPFDIGAVRAATTIGEFDDAFIAPIYGFKNRQDYYVRQGSKHLLKHVRVPLFALNSLDDPIIDSRSLPTDADVSSAVSLFYTARGGHCGYISGDARSHDNGDPRNFMPSLLGDFLQHVERALP